jgi:hypothetical protein
LQASSPSKEVEKEVEYAITYYIIMLDPPVPISMEYFLYNNSRPKTPEYGTFIALSGTLPVTRTQVPMTSR